MSWIKRSQLGGLNESVARWINWHLAFQPFGQISRLCRACGKSRCLPLRAEVGELQSPPRAICSSPNPEARSCRVISPHMHCWLAIPLVCKLNSMPLPV